MVGPAQTTITPNSIPSPSPISYETTNVTGTITLQQPIPSR